VLTSSRSAWREHSSSCPGVSSISISRSSTPATRNHAAPVFSVSLQVV
jgi:hypothetical protein